ncbi:MAG: hypothetical protein ABSD21_05380 [Rhizomicrobium sp.]|jgi:hypothetical protein
MLKPLLPAWRYWPAIPLAALVIAACVSFASPIPPFQENPVSRNGTKPGAKPQKVDPNERLADYTLLLMIFTGALVIVGALQIRLLFKADQTARRGLEIAGQQTALTGAQADILDKQKEIQRLQFMTEYGPQLRVRNIVIFPPPDTATQTGILFEGLQWSGQCYVENIGGMTTTVLESHLMVYANQMGLPMESPYERLRPNNVISGKFNIGESKPFPFTQISPLATNGEAARAFGGLHPLYVLGWIHYRDDSAQGIVNGVIHRLTFCRQWNHSLRRFVRVENDPDYEHEG